MFSVVFMLTFTVTVSNKKSMEKMARNAQEVRRTERLDQREVDIKK